MQIQDILKMVKIIKNKIKNLNKEKFHSANLQKYKIIAFKKKPKLKVK